MPKIIENLKEKILEEAKREIETLGYAKTTVRSVAANCGVGVGTIYNYFKSKDMMIATFMLEDWNVTIANIQRELVSAEDREATAVIYRNILSFISSYSGLFADKDARDVFLSSFSSRHGILVSQISRLIFPVCEKYCGDKASVISDFFAETMLIYGVKHTEYGDIEFIFLKILEIE